MREYRLKRKGHTLFHDQSHEQLNTLLRKPLPSFVMISQVRCPGIERRRMTAGRRQKRERQAVCIDKRYSERPYQVVVPQRRFAGTVVTSKNDRERFVAGNRLE